MSEQKKIEKLKERKILPNELKYIEAMSELLANESGMDKDCGSGGLKVHNKSRDDGDRVQMLFAGI